MSGFSDFLDELGLATDGQLTHGAALIIGRGSRIAWLKPGEVSAPLGGPS